MSYTRKHPLLTALLINTVLFSGIIAFCYPIFNSGDDVYLLYLLGGGFGEQPTELLHYHYGMHPFLGWMLKNMFIYFPHFNWYTALLYCCHFSACTIFLFLWIRNKNFLYPVVAYLLMFAGIEMRFLLQPAFTNTALVTALAGLLLLHSWISNPGGSKIFLISGSVFVLVAAFLRLHMLVPPLIIAAPFLFLYTRKQQLKKILIPIASLLILVFFFVFLQSQYYKNRIPGWKNEEAYRQTVINHYNSPKKTAADLNRGVLIRENFLEAGILWDKEYLSLRNVAHTTAQVKVTGAWQQSDFGERLYWIWMDSRLGILIMMLLFLWKWPSLTLSEKIKTISSAVLMVSLCLALLLFRKLPGYFIAGSMFSWMVFMGVSGSNHTTTPARKKWLFGLVALGLMVWSVVRVIKLNRWNIAEHLHFECAYRELSARRNMLFIVTDDKFPMDYMHVWDTPRRYTFPNLLYKDHFLNNTYQYAYKRFGITEPVQFVNNQQIVFTGSGSAYIGMYFDELTKRTTELVAGPPVNNCFPTFQLNQLPLRNTSTR
ncbi:MAG TPA: hypothetical protein VGD17_02690 [Chitinophagaceae bacterium]